MYKIVEQISAHEGPVRCLARGPLGELISGGQDSQVKRWLLTDNISFGMGQCCELMPPVFHHSHWVVSLSSISPCDQFPTGAVVTGCQDGVIRIFDPESDAVLELRGHNKGVISLSTIEDAPNQLLSGSWDGTARLWDITTMSCVRVMDGHENGVHVLPLPDNRIATVSTGEQVNNRPANFRLRFWNRTTGQREGDAIMDHSGPIRCIFPLRDMPGGFATTSNDGTIALRDSAGSVFGTVFHDGQDDGSPPFILDGTCLQSDSASTAISSNADSINGGLRFVTCGEDGSVNVWNGTEILQRIMHPCSVWCVSALPDGAFASAGHDGIVRIFSQDTSKTTVNRAVSLQQQFELDVGSAVEAKRRRTGPSAEELAKAPNWSKRHEHPGKSEGMVCVFNKESKAIAAQWSADAGAWVEIGDVLGSNSGGVVNGKQYDNVIPVEIESPNGLVKLNLGHNVGENPFSAAQRFIDENSLGPQYLGQIADFIMSRIGAPAVPTFDLSNGNGMPSHLPGNLSAAPTPPATKQFNHLPARSYTYFSEVPPVAKIMAKVNEFNADTNALSIGEISDIETLLKTLEATSFYHVSTVLPQQIKAMLKSSQWSVSSRSGEAPGRLFICLDICRLVAVHPSGAETLSRADVSSLRAVLAMAIERITEGPLPSPRTTDPTILSALKMLCNFFKTDGLRSVIFSRSAASSSLFESLLSISEARLIELCSCGKTTRSSLSALLMNCALYLGPLTRGVVSATIFPVLILCCNLMVQMLRKESENADVVTKLVFGLGTAMYYDDDNTLDHDAIVSSLVEIVSDGRGETLLTPISHSCISDIASM